MNPLREKIKDMQAKLEKLLYDEWLGEMNTDWHGNLGQANGALQAALECRMPGDTVFPPAAKAT